MTPEEVIERIQFGLKECSATYGIEPKDIRVKISKEVVKGRMGESISIKCYVMENEKCITHLDGKNVVLNLKDLLGINPMVSMLLDGFLKKSFTKLANKNKIKEDNINARIFTTSLNFYPSIYLYKGDIAVNPITVSDLIN